MRKFGERGRVRRPTLCRGLPGQSPSVLEEIVGQSGLGGDPLGGVVGEHTSEKVVQAVDGRLQPILGRGIHQGDVPEALDEWQEPFHAFHSLQRVQAPRAVRPVELEPPIGRERAAQELRTGLLPLSSGPHHGGGQGPQALGFIIAGYKLDKKFCFKFLFKVLGLTISTIGALLMLKDGRSTT